MCNLFLLQTRTQCSFCESSASLQLHSLAAKPTGMSPPRNRPPFKFLNSGRLLRSAVFASFQPSKVDWTQIHPALSGTKRQRSSCTCLWSVTEVIGGDGAGEGDGVSVTRGLQLNVQASRSMIRKSSVSDRQQLLKVKQGLLRPMYRFSSTHRPKWPLKEESAELLVQTSTFWTATKARL